MLENDKYEEEPPLTSPLVLFDTRVLLKAAIRRWTKATKIASLSERRRAILDKTLQRMQDALADIEQEIECRV